MKTKSTNIIVEFQTFTLDQIQQAYRNVTKDEKYKFKLPKDTPEKCQEILEVLAKDGRLFTANFDGMYYAYFSNMAGIIYLTVASVPRERLYPIFQLNEIVNSNKPQ